MGLADSAELAANAWLKQCIVCSYLGTPNLVRETSRRWFWQRQNKGRGQRRDFGDIILQPALHDQVRTLTASSANTRLHQAPFRHMLFYGPPGLTLHEGCTA